MFISSLESRIAYEAENGQWFEKPLEDQVSDVKTLREQADGLRKKADLVNSLADTLEKIIKPKVDALKEKLG